MQTERWAELGKGRQTNGQTDRNVCNADKQNWTNGQADSDVYRADKK